MEIQERLDAIISQSFNILVGDANGADKVLQGYLQDNHYTRVTVYCSGGHCRNNVGSWDVYNVQVTSGASGRDFYTQKDRLMAMNADYGFVLWDGKSPGSIANVICLLKDRKSSLVYYSPEKDFVSVSTLEQLKCLLARPSFEALSAIEKKIKLGKLLDELEPITQKQMSFELPQYVNQEN